MNNENYISVTDLNRYLAYKFDTDAALSEVYLTGELSNFKQSGKHYYFSIKDQNSEISGMYFYPANQLLKFRPEDGMSVNVVGKISVYQKRGTYSIIVSRMEQVGIGLLYQRYLELKDKLFREGLFDESKKLKVPDYPEHVGIITAPTGEAINDIVSTFNRRFPLAHLTLFPALVQGLGAPSDLIRALKQAYEDSSLDVIIIGRGGGSFEDLNCFNDELLARTLFASPIPTISAVGHEGDYTICDFVASYRAPTPTGAAMRLTKLKSDVEELLYTYQAHLASAMKAKLINSFQSWNKLSTSYGLTHFDELLQLKENNVNELNNRLQLLSPDKYAIRKQEELHNLISRLDFAMSNTLFMQEERYHSITARMRKELIMDDISSKEIIIENLSNSLDSLIKNKLETLTNSFNRLVEKSELLNPLHILKKGYVAIYKDDAIVTDSKLIHEDDEIKIRFSDAIVRAKVIEKGKIENGK